MKRVNTLFVLFFLFLGIGFGVVQAREPHHGRLGYQVFHFSYDEPNMEENGLLHGITGHYRYTYNREVELVTDGGIAGGGLDYDGQTLGEEPRPVRTETDDQLISLEVFSRFTRGLRGSRAQPEVGLGVRHWSNEIQDRNGVSGLQRETRYLYLPIGVYVPLESNRRWTSSFRTGYRVFLEGEVQSHLSNFKSCYPDVTNKQNNGGGWAVSYTAERNPQFGRKFSFTFFLRAWDIDQSNLVETNHDISEDGCNDGNDRVFEPENETLSLGTAFAIHF